jgi:hypothetical protein
LSSEDRKIPNLVIGADYPGRRHPTPV